MSETVIINGVESIRSFDFEVSPTPEIETKVSKPKKEKKEKAEKIPKERINGLIPKVLYDKLKNIALWHPEITMTDLLTQGCALIAAQYPDLPVHDGKLKIGRRPKAIPTESPISTKV
jgi:hypothetical protein